MFLKNLMSIDRFYLILAAVFLALFFLAIFVSKNIFSTIKTAAEIDEKFAQPIIEIKLEKIDEAYKAVFNRENISLDLAK